MIMITIVRHVMLSSIADICIYGDQIEIPGSADQQLLIDGSNGLFVDGAEVGLAAVSEVFVG